MFQRKVQEGGEEAELKREGRIRREKVGSKRENERIEDIAEEGKVAMEGGKHDGQRVQQGHTGHSGRLGKV